MRSPMFYKPRILTRILWAIVITLVALAIIFGAVLFARWYYSHKPEVKINDSPTVFTLNFDLEPGIHYEHIISNNALFFYSAENVKVVNTNGDLTEELSLKMSHPVATVKGDYTLFYDTGGKNITIFNKTKQKSTLSLEDNILLASVNESGHSLVVTKGTQHKCAVRVFNTEGEEIFKWNSGNLSVVGADLSSNNKDITVSAVNTDEGMIKTHLIMFNIAKEKPFTNDIYEKKLYTDIRYSGSYVYCIGSSETRIYNGYGKCVGVAEYDDRELFHYALSNDLFVMAFSGSSETVGATAELKSYNHKGEEIGNFSCLQAFDFLSVKGSTVVLNNGRTLSVLNNRCQENRQLNLGVDLRDFAFWSNQNKGIGITASGAVLIQLNS